MASLRTTDDLIQADYQHLSSVIEALNSSATPMKAAEALTPLFVKTMKEANTLSPDHARFVQATAMLAADELEDKTSSLWFRIFGDKHEKEAIRQTINFLRGEAFPSAPPEYADTDMFEEPAVRGQKTHSEPEIIGDQSEEALFLNFLRDIRKSKGAKAAPSESEFQALKLISRTIYDKSGQTSPEDYKRIMTSIYEGEHVLIEDGSALYEELKQIQGSGLRWSSHYDKGAIDGRAPKDENELPPDVNPQYDISGDHVKELLFGKVTLAVNADTNEPFFSKTAREILELANEDPVKYPVAPETRTYTWFQMEGSKDNDSIFHIDWWNHKVRDFGLYVFRKLFNFEKPNVGPYGFGHGDNRPTVLGVDETVFEAE